MTKPEPAPMTQLHQAAAMAKRLLDDQNKMLATLKPCLQQLEYLDRELARTHETYRAKLEARADAAAMAKEEAFLECFRDQLVGALNNLATIADSFSGKAGNDDRSNHPQGQNESPIPL